MRIASATLLGIAATAAFAVLLKTCADSRRDHASRERGRHEGVEAAEADLARGTPSIRRCLEDHVDSLGSDGLGIDRETGLPVRNATLMCGTGVDFIAYAAEIEAYNERILAAWAEGRLKRHSLSHKLRTPAQVRALFAAARPVHLARDGDTLGVAGGKYTLTYHDKYGGRSTHLTLTGPDGEPQTVRTIYPYGYVDLLDGLRPGFARGPFRVIVVDEETTAIARDADAYAWVIDLPRGIIVQVAGPVRSAAEYGFPD
jgi:hypothetical protein